jgi:hypothetical protein
VTRQEYNGGLIAKIVEAAMAERYRLYSHLNFTTEQWREVAGRYLKLDDALAQLERAALVVMRYGVGSDNLYGYGITRPSRNR